VLEYRDHGYLARWLGLLNLNIISDLCSYEQSTSDLGDTAAAASEENKYY